MEYKFTEQLREVPPYKPSVLGCMVQLFLIVTVLAFAVTIIYLVLYLGGRMS